MADAVVKFTLNVDPEWAVKAVMLAEGFVRKFGHEGRTRQSQCVVYEVNGIAFAAWGDRRHVRVTQAPPPEATANSESIG